MLSKESTQDVKGGTQKCAAIIYRLDGGWIRQLSFFTIIVLKINHFNSHVSFLCLSGTVRGYCIGVVDNFFVQWF